MARQTVTYEQVMASLRKGEYKPVYLLMGEEDYFIDSIADYIKENALTEDEKTFDLSILYGKDIDCNQLIMAAKRYPMMAKRQVIIVREAQNIRDLANISLYMKQPQPSTVLVLCHKHSTADMRKKFVADIEKAGVVFVSKRLYDNQIPQWISRYAESLGLSLPGSASALAVSAEKMRYAEESAVRHAQSGMSDGRFAVVDDAIMRLADALADEYEAVYGPDAQRNGQDYADYLLSFVQFAIQYPIELEYEGGEFVPVSGGNGDLYLYGTEEYWAYPMETLYHRMGDCEDTSFLLAALCSASGYTSSTIRVSGHMVVGVELDLFEPDGFYANHLRVSDVTLDGTHLWLCETSYDQYVPVGLLNIKSDLEASDIRQYAFVTPVVTTKGAASA